MSNIYDARWAAVKRFVTTRLVPAMSVSGVVAEYDGVKFSIDDIIIDDDTRCFMIVQGQLVWNIGYSVLAHRRTLRSNRAGLQRL